MRYALPLTLVCTTLLAACGGDGSDSEASDTAATNHVPELAVLVDQNINSNSSVTVTASASDSDGDALSWQWQLQSQPSGSAITLNQAQTASVQLTPVLTGAYQLQVTVSDGKGGSDQGTVIVTVSESSSNLPVAFSYFTDTVQISIDGNFYVLRSNGVPNHDSPYFAMSDSRYEANTTPGFVQNPNSIQTQNLTFRIPRNPAEAGVKQATPMGPIGIALNGVPLYNQYAAGGAPLTNEIFSFDQYTGHPQNSGQYHYHKEPLYITQQMVGKSGFIGFLLDGFPVYGPQENGVTVNNNDLDVYHGHTHATADYPQGIYHYHVTDADPYINGSGFFGTVGTVSQ